MLNSYDVLKEMTQAINELTRRNKRQQTDKLFLIGALCACVLIMFFCAI